MFLYFDFIDALPRSSYRPPERPQSLDTRPLANSCYSAIPALQQVVRIGQQCDGIETGQAQAHAMEAVEMAHYAAFLKMQLAVGTDEARETALRGFLEMNEARRERRSPLYLQNVYAVDAGTAWVRLADLLERRGASAEAKDALHRALSYCSLTGWKDCSVKKFQEYARNNEGWGVFVGAGLGH